MEIRRDEDELSALRSLPGELTSTGRVSSNVFWVENGGEGAIVVDWNWRGCGRWDELRSKTA